MSNQTVGEFFTVRCGPCGGSGKIKANKKCMACRGEGAIVLRGSIENYRDCPGCAASGYKGFNVQLVCTLCDGVGALRLT